MILCNNKKKISLICEKLAEREGFEPLVQISLHGHPATPCINLIISINTDSLQYKV